MAKQKSTGEKIDLSTMSEEQLREYASKLEGAIAKLGAAQSANGEKSWDATEKRTVMIPLTATGHPITISGKAYAGRMKLDRETYFTVLEMHARANRQELARLQQRGNLVSPHLLASDDVSSRYQPELVASL